jgi:hypothetical protein
MLGKVTTDPTPAGMPIVEQEAEIFMTWNQLKNLTLTMQLVIQMTESEIGPIPISLTSGSQEAALDTIRAHLRNLNFPQVAKPQSDGPS